MKRRREYATATLRRVVRVLRDSPRRVEVLECGHEHRPQPGKTPTNAERRRCQQCPKPAAS